MSFTVISHEIFLKLFGLVEFSGKLLMNIGDLVTMDYSDWPEGDEWGVGIIVEIDKDRFYNDAGIAIYWSKIGLSWENREMLVGVNENR